MRLIPLLIALGCPLWAYSQQVISPSPAGITVHSLTEAKAVIGATLETLEEQKAELTALQATNATLNQAVILSQEVTKDTAEANLKTQDGIKVIANQLIAVQQQNDAISLKYHKLKWPLCFLAALAAALLVSWVMLKFGMLAALAGPYGLATELGAPLVTFGLVFAVMSFLI